MKKNPQVQSCGNMDDDVIQKLRKKASANLEEMVLYDTLRYNIIPPVFLIFFTAITQASFIS